MVKSVSSRLMYARLKFVLRSGGVQWLRVICAYAPTFHSLRGVKDSFFADLQAALHGVCHDEEYVIMDDFNARVGSRLDYDEWSAVRGPYGFGQLNSSGAELLDFLSRSEATICNTWFRKKPCCMQTWQHPHTKAWHCIDYLIISQDARRRCRDAQVLSRAEYGSDHNLLCMRLDFCVS